MGSGKSKKLRYQVDPTTEKRLMKRSRCYLLSANSYGSKGGQGTSVSRFLLRDWRRSRLRECRVRRAIETRELTRDKEETRVPRWNRDVTKGNVEYVVRRVVFAMSSGCLRDRTPSMGRPRLSSLRRWRTDATCRCDLAAIDFHICLMWRLLVILQEYIWLCYFARNVFNYVILKSIITQEYI